MKTHGISPKVWAPVAAQLVAVLVNLIASGDFDRTELAQIVGAGLTALFGFWASPGAVDVEIGPASDDLLHEHAGA